MSSCRPAATSLCPGSRAAPGAEHGNALVANLSSIAAKSGQPWLSVYSATKAFVSHLTRHLRTELRPKNIRVSGSAPGITATPKPTSVD